MATLGYLFRRRNTGQGETFSDFRKNTEIIYIYSKMKRKQLISKPKKSVDKVPIGLKRFNRTKLHQA